MLPTISLPEYEVVLPSDQRKVKFHPFRVSDEKILLMAQASEDPVEIISAVKQLIKNNIKDESFDVDNIPAIDLEYLFIKLRARSVGNVIELVYQDIGEEGDGQERSFLVNLDEVEPVYTPGHTNIIKVTDNISINMKYPGVSLPSDINTKSDVNIFFDIVISCIDSITDGDKIIHTKDCETEELNTFVHSLPVPAFIEIQKFFETSPKICKELVYTNAKGVKRVIQLKTLSDFFSF